MVRDVEMAAISWVSQGNRFLGGFDDTILMTFDPAGSFTQPNPNSKSAPRPAP
jgi:hypothetical protein